jgi:hypothetical protein
MTVATTDVRGTAEHQIEVAAKALGGSSQRRAVFREIHSGKKRIKTIAEIAKAVALPRKRVLEEAVKLAHKQIITKTNRDGDMAYERDNFYYAHRTEIFRRADELSRPGRIYGLSSPSRSRRPRPSSRSRRRPLAKRYDVFLSHASEDKKTIARPLYDALVRAGITVWYDDAVLTIGDSLRRKIDEGLSRCRFGIVILSPKFFKKNWSQWELDALVARENTSGEKAILPIWHRVAKTQVAKYSPSLTDKLAGNSKEGIPALVQKIQEALEVSPRQRWRR